MKLLWDHFCLWCAPEQQLGEGRGGEGTRKLHLLISGFGALWATWTVPGFLAVPKSTKEAVETCPTYMRTLGLVLCNGKDL